MTYRRGDCVMYEGREGQIVAAVVLVPNAGLSRLLVRNENGIQRDVNPAEVLEHWPDCAAAAGEKAHRNDPTLFPNRK